MLAPGVQVVAVVVCIATVDLCTTILVGVKGVDVGVGEGLGTTITEKDSVAVLFPSLTCLVKTYVPSVVAVPSIVPVNPSIFNPGGREPDDIPQV